MFYKFQTLLSIQLWLVLLMFGMTATGQEPQTQAENFVGRWDVTVTDGESEYPSWFEIRKSGHKTLVGSYVGQFGSARPVAKVEVKEDTFRFVVPPQWEERASDVVYEGQLNNGQLQGTTTNDKGETIRWQAEKSPPLLPEYVTNWSETKELFNGSDLTGWKPQFVDSKMGWEVQDGILKNVDPGNNLVSNEKFRDFQLHAEFRYPKGSNSGIYLRGRYEVQLIDEPDQAPDDHNMGSIYGYLTPSENAALPAGEWQSIDITLVGRQVTIVLNGKRVIDRQFIPGITGGALDSREGEPGPILIQGDHGPIEFRRIAVSRAADDSN